MLFVLSEILELTITNKMKSKDKKEGCFNCDFSSFWSWDLNEPECLKTFKKHKWDYSCKKWRMKI
jgi:hypothetical protein